LAPVFAHLPAHELDLGALARRTDAERGSAAGDVVDEVGRRHGPRVLRMNQGRGLLPLQDAHALEVPLCDHGLEELTRLGARAAGSLQLPSLLAPDLERRAPRRETRDGCDLTGTD